MNPEDLLRALFRRQAPAAPARDPGPKRTVRTAERTDLSPADAAVMTGPDVLPPGARVEIQPGGHPADPEFLHNYASGQAYLPPDGSVQLVRSAPPPAPNAGLTPHVQYAEPADMTFVRPPPVERPPEVTVTPARPSVDPRARDLLRLLSLGANTPMALGMEATDLARRLFGGR